MNYRKAGFTQRKPKAPGVYFVSPRIVRHDGPRRHREGWEVAEIHFSAGGYGNEHENREEAAHWHIKALGGLEYAWQPGMWTKGPIRPGVRMAARHVDEGAHQPPVALTHVEQHLQTLHDASRPMTFTRSHCDHCEHRRGLYLADCRGCAARAVAKSPQAFEAKTAGKLTPAYRALLERYGITHEEAKASGGTET